MRTVRLVIVTLGVAGCAGELGSEPFRDAGEELAFPGRTGTLVTGVFDVYGVPAELTYELIDGHKVFEGDILLDGEIEHDAAEATLRSELAVRSSKLWPNGEVVYQIDPELPNPGRVHDAIAHWETYTSVRFLERTREPAYVTFRRWTSGCSANVGRLGREQFINLSDNCSTGNAIHEIGHAVGLWHTHARTDRDGYVIVQWENIEEGQERNFETYADLGHRGDDVGAYDVASVMHYGSYAFSGNGEPTLVRQDGSTFPAQRSGLSSRDVETLEVVYTGRPARPRNPEVIGTTSNSVSLAWDPPPDSVDGYHVYRDGGDGNFVMVGTTEKTQHHDGDLLSGQTYRYHIRAHADGGLSAPSDTVTASTKIICVSETCVGVDP